MICRSNHLQCTFALLCSRLGKRRWWSMSTCSMVMGSM